MSAPPPTPDAPPTTGSTPPRRRIVRRTEGHLLAGVASGIADHLRIDPVLARVGFVVLGVWPFPGFGLLLYLALAFALPADDTHGAVPRGAERERGMAFYVGVALLVVAVLALLGPGAAFGAGAAGSGLALPVLLIGIGVALWVSDRGSVSTSGTDGGAWAPPATAAPTTGAAGAAGVGVAPPVRQDRATAPPVWEPPPPPPRSPLGRVTLGAALTVGAALWALDVVRVVTLPASVMLAAVLGVLGVGLLIGSVVGRARWLAWVAAPLAVLLVAVAVVEDLGLPLQAGVGDRVVTVAAPGEGEEIVHRLGAGRLVIDLTEVASEELDQVLLDATVGAGELEVLVPPDLRLTGRVRVELGELSVAAPGRSQGRGSVALDESLDVGPVEAPTLAADLRVGAGQLTVRVVERSPSWGGPPPEEPAPGSEAAPDLGSASPSRSEERDRPLTGRADVTVPLALDPEVAP